MASAIAIAPQGATGPLRALIDRLAAAGVATSVVEDVPSAAEAARAQAAAPPCVLVDLRHLASGSDPADVRAAGDAIRRVAEAIPHVHPVAITNAGDASLVVACIRAGAGDVIDLHLEGTAAARTVVERLCTRQAAQVATLRQAATLRAMVEDMLKDLIRTERRSLDLEDQLARQSGEITLPADTRGPAILLVEPDREIADLLAERLEAAGVASYAYVTGEDAVRAIDHVLGSNAVDLALISVQLPGADGLRIVEELRLRRAGLPAFLLTNVHDAQLAERAADLGVVGFVPKPLADVDEVVVRLAQLAHEALQHARDQVYLDRIKARHERVLARYRSLPREA